MCEIVKKKLWSGIFPILKFPFSLNFSKIHRTGFFLILPVSSSVCNKKIFLKKKNGITGLADANDSKK